jgi:hypothetical protein
MIRKVWAYAALYIYPSSRRLLSAATRVWVNVDAIGRVEAPNAY